ncbi:hypothetical protein PV325_002672 [Microctonus aethiopoides]|nr:hypothetical protein PV325_002672 [Microctonus aethiopoides]
MYKKPNPRESRPSRPAAAIQQRLALNGRTMPHLNDWKFVPRTGIKSIFELKHIHTDTLMKHRIVVKNFSPFEIERARGNQDRLVFVPKMCVTTCKNPLENARAQRSEE